jgi:hypothetical protein
MRLEYFAVIESKDVLAQWLAGRAPRRPLMPSFLPLIHFLQDVTQHAPRLTP